MKGRRALVDGPWDHSIVDGADADIAIDLDAMPAGGDSMDMEANLQVSISYGDGAGTDEFAVIMVAAQHLEAWKLLFAPSRAEQIPSLREVLSVI